MLGWFAAALGLTAMRPLSGALQGLARLGVRERWGRTRWVSWASGRYPPPHPHFGLETSAICGLDAGGGPARGEDLRRALPFGVQFPGRSSPGKPGSLENPRAASSFHTRSAAAASALPQLSRDPAPLSPSRSPPLIFGLWVLAF